MNQLDLIHSNKIRIGDRLVRNKGVLSKHHGIYVGVQQGTPIVAENQVDRGVSYTSLASFLLWDIRNLSRIDRFSGSEYDRIQVIPRINQLLGTKYDLVNFNCEHLPNLYRKEGLKAVKSLMLLRE
jgi:hypothetical protein